MNMGISDEKSICTYNKIPWNEFFLRNVYGMDLIENGDYEGINQPSGVIFVDLASIGLGGIGVQ